MRYPAVGSLAATSWARSWTQEDHRMMARVMTLRNEQIIYRRITLLVALLLLLLTFSLTTTGGVRAAETTTQTFYNATFVIDPDANPCTGARTRTTLVVNGVLRRTDLAT